MSKASNALRSNGSTQNNNNSYNSNNSNNNLQSAKSGGNLSSKPSWTKLQQDNLKAKRSRTSHQSAGFNGLVQASDR